MADGMTQNNLINIVAMTPEELQHGGKNLNINYCFAASEFGELLIASTPKGICYLVFADDKEYALQRLIRTFPNAHYSEYCELLHQQVAAIVSNSETAQSPIPLHINGTLFQLKVWNELLKVAAGKFTTYAEIAKSLGNSKACRAVGTAIGRNPVAYLIPCHRVIQSSGGLGGYMWGTERKLRLIDAEKP